MALKFTKDTISEYDMVLSISEEAINKQLAALWRREIDEEDADGRPKYAINHDWTVQVETYVEDGVEKINPMTGLFAHIKPPRVEFSGEQNGVAIAKMVITFARDDTVVEDIDNHKSPDSLFYKYTGPPWKQVLSTFNLTGWSVSWKVEIGQKDIPDVMNDLINRHKNKDDPTYLPPGVYETLDTINPQLYTVSSIFCLFQNALFVNSFELSNPSGDVITKDTAVNDNNGNPFRQTDAVTMMDHIGTYFTNMQKVKGDEGIPNPNNFVLGYGLMQKIQDLRILKPDASWEKTPAYFLPATYALTSKVKKASAGENVKKPGKPPVQTPQGSKEPALNTLNFCIMTHRSKDPTADEVRTIDPEDQNAGKLVDNFYDVTMTKRGDGIMAWSTDIFWNKWVLGELLSTLWLDPRPIRGAVEKDLAIASPSTDWRQWDLTDSNNPGNFRRDLTFRTYRNNVELAGLGSINYWIDGYSNFNVQAYSDLQMNKNKLPEDYRRRAYITSYVDYKLTVHYESGFITKATPAFDVVVTVRHKICIALEPGGGGVWNVICDASQTLPTTIADALNAEGTSAPSYMTFVSLGDGEHAPEGERGAWVETHQYDSGWILNAQSKQYVTERALTETAAGVRGLMQRLDAALEGMGSCIMMPGGEVMTFNGLTTDTEGRLYAHVVYSLGTGGVKPVDGDQTTLST